MAERVDVCIVGSGFGGSISAYRLAELYRAAGQSPSVLVLERGRRHQHTDFRQSTDIEHLSKIYGLVQGQGAQVVIGDGVGGGSNLYLAASLRSPSETFERRDRRPDDGPERRMWPAPISRGTLDPYYSRVEAGLRVQRPSWKQIAKSGGLWAKTLDNAGYTCDRVPLAIDLNRCIQAKWCHTGCIYAAKNSVNTNYLASAEQMGVEVRPSSQVELVTQSPSRPYRYLVNVSEIDNDSADPTRAPTGRTSQIECKVLILAAGAMGTTPLLMRSRAALPSLSGQVGKNLGVNGDHMAAIEYDEQKVRDVLGLPGYGQFYKGNHITTMTYDFWTGKPAPPTTASASRSRRSIYPRSRTRSTTTGGTRRASPPSTGFRRSRRFRPSTTTSRSLRWSRTRTTASSSRRRRPAATCAPTPARWAWGRSSTSYPSSPRGCARRPTRRSATWRSARASAGS